MESLGLVFYLTKAQITEINQAQVQYYGGSFIPPFNLLHQDRLDYLVEMVQAEMFGAPLYPQIWDKAGLYMFSIVGGHVFNDGNKRTGLQSALIFLEANGYALSERITDEILTDFTLEVAEAKHDLESVQA
jgi:death-on-curing protein